MLIHERHDPPVANEVWEGLQQVAPASIGHYAVGGLIDGAIHALVPGPRLLGRAVTLRQPYPDSLPVHVAFDHLRPGDVLVIDRCGDSRIGCLGEMTVRMGKAQGLAGFVVDGTVTDIVQLREVGLPVYARGLTVAATKPLNAGGAELFAPVVIGGTVIRTGDILLGDENGVLSLSPTLPDLADIIRRSLADEEREIEWRVRIEAGELLSDLSGARGMMGGGQA
jgi:4-hydroxy-4-methyl-2-oxoglutarate aldolase